MKFLLVEPHADDSVLSCSHILEHHDVDIVTVFGMPYCKGVPTYRDSTALTQFFPRTRVLRTYDHVGIELTDWTKSLGRGINSAHRRGKDPLEYMMQMLSTRADIVQQFTVAARVLVDLRADMASGSYDAMLLPLGLLHPDHVAVSYRALDLPTIYYAECPYRFRNYGAILVDASRKGALSSTAWGQHETRSIRLYPSPVKSPAFVKSYPTEAGILRFDHDHVKDDELLVSLNPKYDHILRSLDPPSGKSTADLGDPPTPLEVLVRSGKSMIGGDTSHMIDA